MNTQTLDALLIFLAGGIANMLWMMVNMRIENRLLVKLDGLKAWMLENFVSKDKLDSASRLSDERIVQAKAISDERFGGLIARLGLLESSYLRRPRVNGAALE